MNYSLLLPYKFRFMNDTNSKIINEINHEFTNNFNNTGFIFKNLYKLFSKLNNSYKPYVSIYNSNNIDAFRILINAIKCNIELDFDSKRKLTIHYNNSYNNNTGMSSQIITNITQNNVEIFYQILDFSNNYVLDYDELTLKPGEYIFIKPNTTIRFNHTDDLLIINIEPKIVKYGLIMVPEYDSVFINKSNK